MDTRHYLRAFNQAVTTTLALAFLAAGSFFILEPRVGQAVDSGPFTIKQVITGEISFLVEAANVTMVGDLNGLTGGTSNGTTTAVVTTNSSTGYTMSIAFYDNGTGNAMLGDGFAGESIHDYSSAAGEPTYTFSTASTSAVFGYTVTATDTSDLDQSFLNNGASCNNGFGAQVLTCWMEPTVAGFQIIDRDSAATSGATTTINFRVHVPNNPVPALVTDTYTATATLTALNQ